MRLLKWVCVTTALWLAMETTVYGDCPSAEEIVNVAKKLSADQKALEGTKKYFKAAAGILGVIGLIATVATAGTAAAIFGPAIAAVGASSGLIAGGLDIFSPNQIPGTPVIIQCSPPDPTIPEIKALVEKIGPSITNLSNLVTKDFDEMQKRIGDAVEEIKKAIDTVKIGQFEASWRDNVVAPLEQLRIPALKILNKNLTLVRADVNIMADTCKGDHARPLVIATHIWAMFAAGCNPNSEPTTIIKGPFCDVNSPYFKGGPCREVNNECYVNMVIRNSGHNHTVSGHLLEVVAGTLLELTTYQMMCSNFTYSADPEMMNETNNLFIEEANKIVTQTQDIIVKETERFWPGPAEKLLASVLRNETRVLAVVKAQKAFHETFSWYRFNFVLELVNKGDSSSNVSSLNLINAKRENGYGTTYQIFAARYRYANEEDKEILKKKVASHINWMSSRMTGEYSHLTVSQFLDTITEKDDDWTQKTMDVLQKFDSGYVASDRMSEFANKYDSGRSGFVVNSDYSPECVEIYKEGSCMWISKYKSSAKNNLALFISV